MALAGETAPRVVAYAAAIEDLSGLEPKAEDWFDPAALPTTVGDLLAEIGRVYAPLLMANAQGVMSGADSVETVIDGRKWVQQPFPYQAKCLNWLRQDYQALAPDRRAVVDKALAGTGCEVMFGDL